MVKKASTAAPADAEADERRRLRSLAFSNGLLQRGDPAAPRAPLAPAAAITRLQGRDVVRRGGQRKSRYLFSFPGLLVPAASGGRVGELADLGTKNPVLYLEFPQGRMKLFGTHVYPKNKYLTLQMNRSAKGVVCEDVFESLIVFSEAWWVGTKEDNPEELKLEFPKEFQNDGTAADCDFRGGAGAAIDEATGSKTGKEIAEPRSPKFASDDDGSEDSDHKDENNTQTMSGTPVRQSARNAGKTLKRYTDLSSGGDSSDNDDETAEVPEDLDDKEMESPEIKDETESEDIKPADSSTVALSSKKEPLVLATLSSMFKKAEEKKRSTRSPKGPPATKGAAAKKQRASPMAKQPAGIKKASGTRGNKKQKVEEDEIEELSSSSQDNAADDDDDSDEDWAK
ncbi:DNA-binding protein RHL1-like [Miscanthus floridulus]|uniref:DNA-binding protein RHL1-like n=1 Tax=Miscanthus floridulus TaxID=154761 RepID=UPI00345B423B